MWCFFSVVGSLSTIFDTIDHEILQRRLESIVFTGRVLEWIGSNLSNSIQSININETLSAPAHLHFEVPQGSVLVPSILALSQI